MILLIHSLFTLLSFFFLNCFVSFQVPPLKVLEFLSHFVDVCVEYFGSELTEDEIKDHAVIIYQLLDEMLDGGVPYLTEINILKEIIAPPRLLTRMANALRIGSQVSDSLPDSASSNIPWRKSSARYANNEMYVDLIEELDVTIDNVGMMSNIGIYGQVMANCKLSGMPDLAIKFKNPQLLEECRFHPCVRYVRDVLVSSDTARLSRSISPPFLSICRDERKEKEKEKEKE